LNNFVFRIDNFVFNLDNDILMLFYPFSKRELIFKNYKSAYFEPFSEPDIMGIRHISQVVFASPQAQIVSITRKY
jgi:hypothetical protein